MQDEQLGRFLDAAKQKGASDEFLAAMLVRRGWPADDVYAALGDYWERQTGLGLPDRSRGGESSRDAFFYLLAFSTLATWSSALGSILFAFIDHRFADPVAGAHLYDPRLHVTGQMASVAVAFPIFLLAMRFILREALDNPQRLESGVRKWLTYIALLLTAGGVICDLIWFLNYFLQGELTVRFVLKAATILVICGAIFLYYLRSLRWDRHTDVRQATRRSLVFGATAAVGVIASFCVGMSQAGTPGMQRLIEADARRIQDLQETARGIHFWWQQHSRGGETAGMPVSLYGLPGAKTTDRQTGQPYQYRVKIGSTYELCADFETAPSESDASRSEFWQHGKGQTCFTLNASEMPPWR